MPSLLEDLAEETSASIWRAAARLDEEARELDGQRRAEAHLEELKRDAVESARQATSYALSRLPEAEAVWQLALLALMKEIAGEEATSLLRTLRRLFEAGQRLCKALLGVWGIAEKLGATPESLDDLERGARRFAELNAQVILALEHHEHWWDPADPTRLALGLGLAREGKTIKADEARSRFRRN